MVTKDYAKDGITVHWDSDRCIHTGVCLRASPGVFDVRRRPWIDLEAGSVQEIADAVARCPSGALRFTSDVVSERLPERTEMHPVRGGPMVVRGPIEIRDANGDVVCIETRATLCRCGNSGNQPFCDNSHRKAGFEEPELRAPAPAEAPDEICATQPGFEED